MMHRYPFPRIQLLLPLLLMMACAKAATDTATPKAAESLDAARTAEPIPEGFFSLTPQLAVPDVDAATAFYSKAFAAEKILSLAGPDGKTMHAEVKIGDSVVMIDISHEGLNDPMTLGGTPVGLMLYVPDADEVWNTALAAGARAEVPIADMFWGDRYGSMLDPFGHRWSVATHIEDLTPEQMQQRAELSAQPPAADGTQAWASIQGTPAAQAVPSDYHTVTMGLVVDDAAKAIEFYKEAFGATEHNRMPTPDGRLLHAELRIGDSVLMLSDEFPDMDSKSAATLGGSPVRVHHYVADVDATFAQAVELGAKVVYELYDMFWGDRFGVVVDPVGIGWGLATHKEDVEPEQMQVRMKAQMGGEVEGGDKQ